MGIILPIMQMVCIIPITILANYQWHKWLKWVSLLRECNIHNIHRNNWINYNRCAIPTFILQIATLNTITWWINISNKANRMATSNSSNRINKIHNNKIIMKVLTIINISITITTKSKIIIINKDKTITTKISRITTKDRLSNPSNHPNKIKHNTNLHQSKHLNENTQIILYFHNWSQEVMKRQFTFQRMISLCNFICFP